MSIRSSIKNFLGLEKRKKSNVSIMTDSNRISDLLSRTIFNIPEIRTVVEKISETFSTIPIYRKRINNITGEVTYIEDTLTYTLNYSPNIFQNKSQFWNLIINKLLLNNLVAIEIIYDNGNLQLYPLQFYKARPQEDFKTIIFKDDPYQKKYMINDLIILSRFSEFGRGTENHATDLYEKIINSIQARAVANTADGKKIVAAVKRSISQIAGRIKTPDSVIFVNEISDQVNASNLEGFAYLDGATDIIPLNIPEIKIEKELLKIIIEATYNYMGASEVVVKGIANEIEYEQFIMGIQKFISMQASQEFTRKLYTEREIQFGNRIEFDYFDIQISSLSNKINLMQTGINYGYLNQNECREKIGEPPLPNGLGSKYRGSLNSVNLEIIDKYQLNKANSNGGFTENDKI